MASQRDYRVHSLVWYEAHDTAESAIEKEKNIKKWERKCKLELIEKSNPEWNDLYHIICEDTGFPLNPESLRDGNDGLKDGIFRLPSQVSYRQIVADLPTLNFEDPYNFA